MRRFRLARSGRFGILFPMRYARPPGGLPPDNQLMTGRAVFKTAYAMIPRGVMTDIVTSNLPGWDATRAWVIARPMTGFAETFSQLVVEVSPGGGADRGEAEAEAEGVIFVTEGSLTLSLGGEGHVLDAGGYAFLAPGADWSLMNAGEAVATFIWVRKRYQRLDGVALPQSFVASDAGTPIQWMPDRGESWGTQRFVDPYDLSHDMHVNIVTFAPGGSIPFLETHVMEHGLYVLEGRAVYVLNEDRVEVEAGDFMWLRAFCPQACYATGRAPFRYLLYKDVNRMPPLGLMP